MDVQVHYACEVYRRLLQKNPLRIIIVYDLESINLNSKKKKPTTLKRLLDVANTNKKLWFLFVMFIYMDQHTCRTGWTCSVRIQYWTTLIGRLTAFSHSTRLWNVPQGGRDNTVNVVTKHDVSAHVVSPKIDRNIWCA